MKLIYNRFALIPFHCTDCHRYIWLEPYRKAEVCNIISPLVPCFTKKKICSDCLPKYDIKYANKYFNLGSGAEND